MNGCTVGIIRHGAGVLDWMKEELKTINIKTRKSMTMNGSLHWRGNQVDFTLQILDFKKGGGRGLISPEECVKVEVQSLEKYLSESKEWMLKFVAGEKRLSEVENPDTFKK